MEKKFQNEEENEQFNLSNDGSICGYDSLHLLLKDNLKPHHFQVTLLYSHTHHVHAFEYYSIFMESELDMCCRKSIACLLDLIVEKHLKQLLYLNLLLLSPSNMVLTFRYEHTPLLSYETQHIHGREYIDK